MSASHEITPRRVAFDWSRTPLRCIPGEPTATHVMGQKATHSVQHTHVREHLAGQRLDTADFTQYVGFLFERLLGERPPLGAPIPERERVRFLLTVVAAIEQFTAVFGDRVPAADGLDRARADEVMLDLLRRHGAEKVEHRAVAFDRYQHCGGTGTLRCACRVAGMAVAAPVMLYLWIWGTAYLIRQGPRPAVLPRHSLADHNRMVRTGLLPPRRELGAAIPRYFRRTHHPSQEGSPSRAAEYLRGAPTARAAS
ncbi:metal-dependent hydrolase [Streptomyces sp. NPDC050619]|uniref:metal-dependent hydrolase n=1 Tax=Streptomyces sp. NPDC050619 TaxID=3157214 RepID=UPI003447EBDA